MQFKTILSASVLAGAVLLSATACSGNNDSTPEATASATETPTATTAAVAPTVTPEGASESVEASTEKVVGTVIGYYDYVSSPESLAKVQQAGTKLSSVKDVTDADIAQLATDFPEGFQYFDASSSPNITNAYNQLFANTTESNKTPVQAPNVPAEAVVIDGNKATVKANMVTVTTNGQEVPVTGSPYFAPDVITLVKKADGDWVMIAAPARQATP